MTLEGVRHLLWQAVDGSGLMDTLEYSFARFRILKIMCDEQLQKLQMCSADTEADCNS